MGKKKTKDPAHEPDTTKEEEDEDGIADISTLPLDPLISRSDFAIRCVVGYATALMFAAILIVIVIVTTPSTESAESYSSDQHIVSALSRVGNSIASHPIASLNVLLIYVILPFMASIVATKGGIALLRAIMRRRSSIKEE